MGAIDVKRRIVDRVLPRLVIGIKKNQRSGVGPRNGDGRLRDFSKGAQRRQDHAGDGDG